MINMTTINVFYYDSDTFDFDEVVTMQEYLKQALPKDAVVLYLPKGKVELQQYWVEEKELNNNALQN